MKIEERVARIISSEWFDENHVLNNYPNQHLKYQEQARKKAKEIINMVTNRVVLISVLSWALTLIFVISMTEVLR